MRVVVMGVSGSGKSTLGENLAKRLSLPFIEGDELHPKANVDKMAQGIALDDEDRWPWLRLLGEAIAQGNGGAVASCSSLKKSYRDLLREVAGPELKFIYLHGEKELLAERIGGRKGHYMPSSLLQSQLDTLEDPRGENGVTVLEITETPDTLLEQAVQALGA